jgi:hypothetical protein
MRIFHFYLLYFVILWGSDNAGSFPTTKKLAISTNQGDLVDTAKRCGKQSSIGDSFSLDVILEKI